MMKHLMLALALAGVVYSVTPSVAQDSPSSEPPSMQAGGPPDHGRGRFDPAQRTEMLTKHLKLNSDQQAKVLDILKSQQSQMESLRSDTSTPQQDRRSKMMDLHKATDDQIRGVLDSNQQKKWDEMQSKRQQWQGHRHEGQAPAAPDAAPQQ
jgi:periplasmic protein CpxP/Spy